MNYPQLICSARRADGRRAVTIELNEEEREFLVAEALQARVLVPAVA